ncbi:hypothetical protein Q8A67_024671 [Cirrhinus molitorella]|uniref:Uncharacterized protein n=1 Tax=Cirrhinus molitorella TaxID=172907 RepID=A0AA88P516_9TELE|nr:hypothetical protein Q8A67_024671 [Cirrhinus molitorella]
MVAVFLQMRDVLLAGQFVTLHFFMDQNLQLVGFRLSRQPRVNSADEEVFGDRSQSQRISSAPLKRYLAWFIIYSDLHEIPVEVPVQCG